LGGIFYFRGKQDCASASSKDRATFSGKFSNRVVKTFFLQKLKLRRALAARKDESVTVFEIRNCAHFQGFSAEARSIAACASKSP